MADEPKKPRKIKRDLKARLGRTIAPNTPGAVVPPSVGGDKKSGGVVPPPSSGKKGGVPAPKMAKASVPANSPFAPKQPTAPPPSNDPFAAAPAASAPQGPQQVRLVLDDSAVDDSEVGKKRRGRNAILLVMGALVGLLLGFGVGSVMNDRKTTNLAIRDASAIHEAVQTASNKVLEAQRLVDQAAAAAVASPPTVDYEAIDALRQIEKPFPADIFSGRTYFLFDPTTVDAIFGYYRNTNEAWASIESIVGLTAGEERRTQLNTAAEAAGDSRSLIGCIPAINENRMMCSLGFVNIEDETVTIRPSRRSRRGVEKVIYAGQSLEENPDQYVMLVNSAGSQGVLGEQATLFNTYLREIAGLKQLLTATVESQGAIENGLGPLAAREEMFAF